VNDVQELHKMNIVEPQPFATEEYTPNRPNYRNQDNAAMYDQQEGYNPDNPVFSVQQNFDRRRRIPPRGKIVGVPEDSIPLQTIPLVPSTFQQHMHTTGPVATTAAGDKRRVVFDNANQDTSEYKRPFNQPRFPNNNNNDSNSIVLHPTVNLNTNTAPTSTHALPTHPHPHHAQAQGNFNNSTLLITNIPPDLNTIDQLNSHFKKFGNLVNIQVKSQANKSYVQFSTYHEALRALRSVEAVLGNRFIKVFWSTSPSDSLAPSPSATSSIPPSPFPASTPSPAPSAPTPALSTSLSASFASHNRVFSSTPQPTSQLVKDIKAEEQEKAKQMLSVPPARTSLRVSDAEITNQVVTGSSSHYLFFLFFHITCTITNIRRMKAGTKKNKKRKDEKKEQKKAVLKKKMKKKKTQLKKNTIKKRGGKKLKKELYILYCN
jgi:hypothetical protein